MQSTMPSLTYGCFDYVTTQNDIEYARQFSDILRKDIHSAEDYDPEDYLTEREKFMREIYDKHCLYAACKGQGFVPPAIATGRSLCSPIRFTQ